MKVEGFFNVLALGIKPSPYPLPLTRERRINGTLREDEMNALKSSSIFRLIFCRAAPWRCRMVMRLSRLQMNCSGASISSSRPKIGIRPTTAASPQTTRARSRVIASFSTESNKSYGAVHCVQNTHGAEFAPLFDTSRSLMFFTRAPSETLIVTITFFDNAHRRHTGLAHYLEKRRSKTFT